MLIIALSSIETEKFQVHKQAAEFQSTPGCGPWNNVSDSAIRVQGNVAAAVHWIAR